MAEQNTDEDDLAGRIDDLDRKVADLDRPDRVIPLPDETEDDGVGEVSGAVP